MAENEKKVTGARSIDDLLGIVRSHPRKTEIEKALGQWDAYREEENQNHIFNNIITPAIDEFYSSLKKKLDDIFKGDDTAKVKNKRTEIQQAIVEGLLGYFRKAMPSVLKGVEKIEDVEEKYETLTNLYDTTVLGLQPGEQAPEGVQRLSGFAEAVTKGKKTTVGHLKRNFTNQKALHAQQILSNLEEKAAEHYVGHIEQPHLALYLLPKVEKEYDVDEIGRYYRLPKANLLQLREGVEKGEWGRTRPEAFGISKKKEEKNYERRAA